VGQQRSHHIPQVHVGLCESFNDDFYCEIEYAVEFKSKPLKIGQ